MVPQLTVHFQTLLPDEVSGPRSFTLNGRFFRETAYLRQIFHVISTAPSLTLLLLLLSSTTKLTNAWSRPKKNSYVFELPCRRAVLRGKKLLDLIQVQ